MKCLTTTHNEDIYKSGLFDFYFSDMRIGALDIETTGLDPSRNKFILGGLFDFTDQTMYEFFAENRGEEKDALEAFARRVSELDAVITYNGNNFDMPFIDRRLAHFSMEGLRVFDLDLYLVVKGYSPIRKFVPNMKQTTVENYMGLWQTRDDEITGADSIDLYNMYEKNGGKDLEDKILLHNNDDVLQLTRLLKVISKCDFHRAMFNLGFPAGPLTVENIQIRHDALVVRGSQRTINADYEAFALGDYPAEIHLDSGYSDFYMKLPVIYESGLVLADLQAAGLALPEFEAYPACGSGFLILEDHGNTNYMETDHFVKSFIRSFIDDTDSI